MEWQLADEKGGAEADEAASGSDREEEDEEDFMSRGRRGGAGAGPGPNGLPKGQADEGADAAVSLYLCPLRCFSVTNSQNSPHRPFCYRWKKSPVTMLVTLV